MTLAEYIEQIRFGVREITPAFFTDDELMTYVNLKELEFVRKTRWLTTELDISWESDGYSVLLPADFLAVDFVLLVEDGSTTFLEKRGGRGRASTSELESGYRLDATKLWLTDETVMDAASVLRLSYIQKPTPYADVVADAAVESDLGDDFSETIINGVLGRALVKQERFPSAQFHEGMYQKGIVEAKRYRNDRVGKNSINIDH
jgi:hypothetical protein